MERHFNNDFERFLRENADQYRMYPSEHVWKGVHKSIHSKRRWIAISVSFLLLIGGLTAILLINDTRRNKSGTVSAMNDAKTETRAKNTAGNLTHPAEKRSTTNAQPVNALPENTALLSAPRPVTIQPVQPRANRIAATPAQPPVISSASRNMDVINQVDRATPKEETKASSLVSITVSTANRIKAAAAVPATVADPGTPVAAAVAVTEEQPVPVNTLSNATRRTEPIEPVVPVITPSAIEQSVSGAKAIITATEDHTVSNPAEPSYTLESILNTNLVRKAVSPRAKRKLAVQLSFVPTISYRRLTENKSFIRDAALQNGGTPNYAYFEGINDAVKHKPDMGLEAGVNVKYPLAKRLNVKAGIQLNVTRYNIRVFNYAGTLTRIALNTGNPADALNTYSTYSNIDGYNQDWLQNLYFQVSAPVGIEYRIGGNDHVSFGIGGTIQPTHILSERAYLLSTDFKNYAEVPWLIRKWNINTSLEAFVSYNTGKLKWQVGPQVRRQLNSSFVKSYPVREFPMDYGLKVGIQLNK